MRLFLPRLCSGDRKLQSIARWTAKDPKVWKTLMSIARWTEKNAKVRKDLNILRAVSVLLIKVLTDLENRRVAFFYRHEGPHGPEEDPLLQPEPLRRAQIALILHILIILAILLQTRELLRASRTLKIGALRFSIDMKGLTDLSGRRDCEGQALALR